MAKSERNTFGSGGRSARVILIVCSLLYMVNYMDRQVLSVVLEPMKAELGLTDSQAGVLQTVFFLSMALMALPISFFVDRWSRRKTVAIMAIAWSAATYVTGLGKSFMGVLVPRAFVGSGEAGFSAGGTAWITAAYPPESRGKALGVFNVALPVGAALGVILGGYLSTHHGGWRAPFYVFAVPGILLGILAFFLPDYQTIKAPDQTAASVRGIKEDIQELWRVPSLRWLFIGYGIHNIMAFSVLSWGPAVLMRTLAISESKAGMIFGLIGMFAIIGALMGGWMADAVQKWNSRGRMILPAVADMVSAILSISALLFIQAFDGDVSLTNPFLATSAIVGLAYGICSVLGMPALGAVTQDVVHPRLKGISWGMTMFCMYMLGGAWGPLIVGALSDHLGGGVTGLQTALIITSTTGFMGGLCFWAGSKHYPADAARVAGYQIESEK